MNSFYVKDYTCIWANDVPGFIVGGKKQKKMGPVPGAPVPFTISDSGLSGTAGIAGLQQPGCWPDLVSWFQADAALLHFHHQMVHTAVQSILYGWHQIAFDAAQG